MALNAALNSGRTSLQTNQKAIEIAGVNIANVNTPGYSRQSANLAPYPVLHFGEYFTGTGVKVDSVERSHDIFLAGQITAKSAEVGLESSMSSPLAELERVLGIGEGSLADEFDQFFDSWRQLSTNSSGEVERQQVLQRGELLAGSFLSVYNQTQGVRGNINATLSSMVDGVNLRLDEVAQLNTRIATIESTGQNANGDRDRRDLLLKELSQSVGARSYEDANGTVSVQLPNGMPLVEDDQVTRLQANSTGSDTELELVFGSTTITLNRSAVGGEIGGLYEVRDVTIPDLVNRLDQLAYTFADEVNTQHQAGTGLDNVTGRDFFTPLGAVAGSASSLAMNITATSELAVGASNSPGDNTNALAMLQLEQKQVLGGDTLVTYYGKIATTIGVETARNRQAQQGFEDSLLQMENLRDSIDGVSIEEEMIELLKFQKGFEASAKFLSTVDEMLDTLLAMKR